MSNEIWLTCITTFQMAVRELKECIARWVPNLQKISVIKCYLIKNISFPAACRGE
jgi:hypothetical protein